MGSLPDSAPLVRVLIAGGSYTGLSTAMNLNDLANGRSPRMAQVPYEHHPEVPRLNVQFTIVDERDGWRTYLSNCYFHFRYPKSSLTLGPPFSVHLIGCPLALADTEYSKKAWIKYADVPALQAPNIRIVQGSVSSVDCEAKTATVIDSTTKVATTHAYDFFVSATGLRRVWPVVPQSLTRKQYLLEAEEHIHAVHNARDGVVVVGGGAVGIEMAAELKFVKPDVKVTLVHSRDKLLSSEGLPDECKDVALELLKEGGVEVLMNHRLASTKKVETMDGSSKYEVEFTNGSKIVASKVILAMSKSVPTTSYLPAEALDEEGRVKIQPS
jgi:NADH dehydrogenase FAD-containing subunit